MSGQWQLPTKTEALIQIEPSKLASRVKLLTTKQVLNAHYRAIERRKPHVNLYLAELTKELNLELQKEE